MAKFKGNKRYTLHFNLDLTFDHNEWKSRETIAKEIAELVEGEYNAVLEITCPEQTRFIVPKILVPEKLEEAKE